MSSKVRILLDQQGAIYLGSRALDRLQQYIQAYHVPVFGEVPEIKWKKAKCYYEALRAHMPANAFIAKLLITRVRPHEKHNPHLKALREKGFDAPKKPKKKLVPPARPRAHHLNYGNRFIVGGAVGGVNVAAPQWAAPPQPEPPQKAEQRPREVEQVGLDPNGDAWYA